VLQQFTEAFDKLYNKIFSWIDKIVLALPNILLATIFLVLSIFIARRLKNFVCKLLGKTTNNQTVIGVLSNIIVAAFMLLVIFVVLNILNLDDALTALLGTAGVAGLAVGLALQDPLVNLFSGVIMSVRDYYQIGDLVETNGFFGKIRQITLRSTLIDMPDGQEVIVPNKEVLQSPLKNFSHNGRRRIDITCGVAYGDDLDKAKRVALGAIEEYLDINESRPLQFYYTEFGDSSINFVIRFWKKITEQADYLEARSNAIIAIKKAFDKEGITIPFPITTLDFGVVGGVNINDIYPPEKMMASSNGASTTSSSNISIESK